MMKRFLIPLVAALLVLALTSQSDALFNPKWKYGLKGTDGAGADTLSYWKILDSLALKTDTAHTVQFTELYSAVHDSSIRLSLGAAMTISGNWVNTANPWATNEGGTGKGDAYTQFGVAYCTTSTKLTSTAAGTSTTLLHGNATGAPTWSAVVSADVTDNSLTGADLADTLNLGDHISVDTVVTGVIGLGTTGLIQTSAGKLHARLIADSTELMTRGNVFGYLYVPLVNIHQPRYVRAANDTLTLETARTDTAFKWLIIGGAADAKGSHLMTATLRDHITEADSLIITYQSSSATAATSAIDSIRVLVTSGHGLSPTWQKSYTTALKSVTQAIVAIDMSTDGDFNEGEEVIIKFFTNADANEWVGVMNAFLVCR